MTGRTQDAMTPHRHGNPFKVPFFVLALVIGLGCAIFGLVASAWWLVAAAIAVSLAAAYCVHALRRGLHGRAFRAPLDRLWAASDDRGDERTDEQQDR